MKITIAIPTIAGRQVYLKSCLETCITQDDDRLEILVSDNSDGQSRDLVESFNDRRIRYVKPDRYLPMSAHWDFMVEHVSGDSLTIIGDDDGLMPQCTSTLREVYRTYGNVAIRHPLGTYFWPDFPDKEKAGTIEFLHATPESPVLVNCSAFLRDICNARQRYIDGPMIYQNFIPTQTLRSCRVGGKLFRRNSPDIYSSVAIASRIPSFLLIPHHLTLPGLGARSNGASVKRNGNDGKSFWQDSTNTDYLIPRFSSLTVQIAVLDCLLEVAERFKDQSPVNAIESVCVEEHIANAVFEVKHQIAKSSRIEEWNKLLKICIADRTLSARVLKVMAIRAGTRIKNKMSMFSPALLDSPPFLQRPATLKVSPAVENIFQATVELQNACFRYRGVKTSLAV